MMALIEATEEVKRELTIRCSVYPRLVAAGKLTQGEADRRKLKLADAVAFLMKLQRNWDVVELNDLDQPKNTVQRHD